MSQRSGGGRPLRVLHVTSGIEPEAGGPTTALMGWTAALAARGMKTSLLSTWVRPSASAVAATLRAAGVHVTLVGPTSKPLSRHPGLRGAVTSAVKGADVIHIHAVWEDIQHEVARSARAAGVPYVFTPHGMLDEWSLAQGQLKKKLYLFWRLRKDLRYAALLHFTTQAERDSVGKLGFRTPEVIEPLGLDLAEFDSVTPAGTFRNRFPEVGERPYLLFLGRIKRGKGLEILLPAFAKLASVGDFQLVIAGPDADFRQEADRLIDALGIRGRVHFTGMIRSSDRIAALREAYLLTLPSFHENFGMVVIESLAVGTPVLISDRVNIHADVTAGRVGAVTTPEIDAFAAELERWVVDSSLREAAAVRAVPFVRARYDWSVLAVRWEEHYRALVRLAGLSTSQKESR